MYPAQSEPDLEDIWKKAAQALQKPAADCGAAGSFLSKVGFAAEVVALADRLADALRFEKLSDKEQAEFIASPDAEVLLHCARASLDDIAPAVLASFWDLLYDHFREQSGAKN